MLEKVDLKQELSKQVYDDGIGILRERLFVLQQELKNKKIPVIILFEGWGAAGKGSTISSVINTLDPRGFNVYSISRCNELERRLPPLFRFWANIPEYGKMSIFDRSWYFDISTDLIDSVGDFEEKIESYDEIKTFERQLTDDGTVVIKLFLHISKKEQKERFEKLLSDKNTSWRVNDKDKKHHKDYEKHYKAFDVMINQTNTINAPWHIISATDRRYTNYEVLRIIIEKIEERIAEVEVSKENYNFSDKIIIDPKFTLVPTQPLSKIDLNKDISDEEYEEKLKECKSRLTYLHNMTYRKKIPVVIVYEGWDAAGKGGNIKRVSSALDPRGYDVIPIEAPDGCELRHHYLWRFWKQIPKTGHIAIFDRSWYGRVMVERVEGFCSESEWLRAYNEINEFENSLRRWGTIIVKFWLQIDKGEQLERFDNREETLIKQYKITDEDWRNREKWNQYESAVNDLIKYTSTDFAPWTIIESNNKKYARIKAMETLIKAIEKQI
ncbi:MAG: polyphosphate:AMP phosphotransferase [Proteocatella sp.]